MLRQLVGVRNSSPVASLDLDDSIAYVSRSIEQHFQKTFGVAMFPETESGPETKSDAESN